MTKHDQSDGGQQLRLSPTVSWHHPDAECDKLQVLTHDGRNITFSRQGAAIAGLLTTFAGGTEAQILDHLNTSSDAAALWELLKSRGLLANRRRQTDWYGEMISHASQMDENYSSGKILNAGLDTPVRVLGDGTLSTLATCAAADLGLRTYDDPNLDGPGTFMVACVVSPVDTDLLVHNERAIHKGSPITFCRVWGGILHIGPVVIPEETACLECLELRTTADLKFPQDRVKSVNQLTQAQPAPSFGWANPALQFLLLRHLASVTRSAYSLVEPGVRYEFDLVSLETASRPVLRLPRCEICGSTRGKPAVAVRSLI